MRTLFIFYEEPSNPVSFPLGIGLLSARLKKHGHTVKGIHIHKELEEPGVLEEIVSSVKQFAPDLLAYSCTSPAFQGIKKIAAHLRREIGMPAICGGPHPTLYPGETLAAEGIDYVCVGEGENTLVEFIRALERGEDCFRVPGISFLNGNAELVKNRLYPLVQDLDALSWIDYDVFGKHFIEQLTSDGWLRHITSRGCPYNCSYCHTPMFRKVYAEGIGVTEAGLGYVRFRSVDSLIDEFNAMVRKYDVKVINFMDDLFCLKKERILEFCRKFKKRLPENVGYSIQTHLQHLDEEMVTAKTAYVRAMPSTTSSKVGRLNAGTKVDVTGKATVSGATWYRVAMAGSRTGYVFGTLLTEIAVSPQPSPAPSRVQPAVGVYPTKPRYAPGDTFKDCRECPEMVVVPAGSFRMGDLNGGGGDDEKPVHRVTIKNTFAVGKFEVTQAEWQAVMGSNPSRYKGSRYPVEQVNWNGAKEFVRKLSAKTGKTYRLLSEAEWEYTARAGSSTKYPWGNGINSSQAKFNSRDGTVPVGSYRPNAFGVYDTVGNVWEWVEDYWHDNYNGAPTNGSVWTIRDRWHRRVLRGGSWYSFPWDVRSAFRNRYSYPGKGKNNGFRVARTF